MAKTKSPGRKPWDIHAVPELGWIHTHGLDRLGLPELEMLHVPGFLMEDAARLINFVGEYLRKPAKPVLVGQTMQTSDHTRFRFVRGTADWMDTADAAADEVGHYAVERWRIVDVEPLCSCCQLRQSERN
jgi:hypothetical protein